MFLRIPVNQTLAQRQSSSDVLQIVANPAWEGDYFVKDVQKNKNLVYLSSKFNSGRITALFSPNGNRNIVNNISSGPQKPTGAFYNHFIIWQGNDTWSDGVLKTSGDFQVIKPYSSQNGYVEWSGKWTNDEVGFVSSLSQKVVEAAYNDLPILVIKNRTTFTATKDINNFRHLYVELGWTANDYRTLTAKTTQGVKTVDLSGQPGDHHFDGDKIGVGSTVIAHDSDNLDASTGLVFDGLLISYGGTGNYLPYDPNEVYIRSWDTFNTAQTDFTDTMEFHVANPLESYQTPIPFSIKAGTVVTFDYFVVVKDGASGTDWVPPLSFLRNLFVQQGLHQEYAMGNYLANRIWWERDDPLGPHWDMTTIKHNLELQYKAFQETGARFGRDEFSWFNIEKSPGNFDWEANDLALSYYDTTDEIQGLLTGTAEWVSDYPSGEEANARKYPAGDDRTWENYIRTVVNRYKNRVKYWEIWSEGDCVNDQGVPVNFIPRPWKTREEEYFRLLRIAYDTIKSIDPTLQVLINGFCSENITGSGVGDAMVQYIMTYGQQPYFDIFNMHTYGGSDPAVYVQNARNLLSRWPSTANKEVWVTETNSHVYLRQHFGGQPGVTIARAAEYMRWWYQRHFDAGASRVFMFAINNWPCEPVEPCFEIPGLVTYMGANRQSTWYEFRDLVYGQPSLRAGWHTNFNIQTIPEFCPLYSYKENQVFWKTGVLNYKTISIPSGLYFLCR